jgi:hypothetical protein
MFYKWENVCRAGCLGKKHWSIIHGQNRLKQLQAGPLHREIVAADFLETFKTWLSLKNFDHAAWIGRQCVQKIWKKGESDLPKARKKGRCGNKRAATDLGEHAGRSARGILTVLPNTSFMVVLCRVPNSYIHQTSINQLQASYTDVRH